MILAVNRSTHEMSTIHFRLSNKSVLLLLNDGSEDHKQEDRNSKTSFAALQFSSNIKRYQHHIQAILFVPNDIKEASAAQVNSE